MKKDKLQLEMSERGHRHHRFFTFGFGFPGFYFGRPWRFGPWGWGFHMGMGFPGREEYRQMLEDYKQDLEDYRRELDEELKRVEEELERLREE